MKYSVIYEPADPAGYGAYVPDLPGCSAVGDTLAEVRMLIREAIEMHLEGMREDGATIPPPTTHTEYIDVQ